MGFKSGEKGGDVVRENKHLMHRDKDARWAVEKWSLDEEAMRSKDEAQVRERPSPKT